MWKYYSLALQIIPNSHCSPVNLFWIAVIMQHFAPVHDMTSAETKYDDKKANPRKIPLEMEKSIIPVTSERVDSRNVSVFKSKMVIVNFLFL